jgi:hypothetical protein
VIVRSVISRKTAPPFPPAVLPVKALGPWRVATEVSEDLMPPPFPPALLPVRTVSPWRVRLDEARDMPPPLPPALLPEKTALP